MKQILLISLSFLFYSSSAQDTIPVIQDIIHLDTLKESISPAFIMQADTALSVNNKNIMPEAVTPVTKKKKFSVDRVRILLGIDFSFLNPVINEKDIFKGPYYPVQDSAPVWIERNTNSNLARQHRAGNLQINVQANFWKGLFFGMNYQFFTIRKYKKDPNLSNLLSKTNSVFFIVSAQVGYVFEFLKNKALQIHPSIRIGGYTADEYYDSGKGQKFYFGTDLQIRYLIKRKAGFSLGFAYDYMQYKKKDYSDIFHRDTYQKTSFNNIHVNAGVYFNISINTKK